MKKLRILCLHGYRQNADLFREKTGAFRKLLKKYAEFEFVTAPWKANVESQQSDKPEEGNSSGEPDPRGWWFSRENNQFSSKDYTDLETGFAESVALVQQTISDSEPYDGILAFSQGACFASLLAALCVKGDFDFGGVRFMILVAGFNSRSSAHKGLCEIQISLPTLLMHGDSDAVISKEMSEQFQSQFLDKTLLLHPGGHFIPPPNQADAKSIIVDFIDRFVER